MNADKNKLRHDAVPTLFAVPNPPRQVTVQRRLPQRGSSQQGHTTKSTNSSSEGLQSTSVAGKTILHMMSQ